MPRIKKIKTTIPAKKAYKAYHGKKREKRIKSGKSLFG